MTEFFKNNPIALRHCLLYKFFYGESVEEAFDKFCDIVGPDVIENECIQYWFNQFEKGKFDDEEQPVTDMRDILRNDKYALRTCVLYESMDARRLQLGPDLIHRFALSMYELFCKVIEDDAMEYREFEFWFYRFLNGNYELNYKRDKDKKIYELMDMPIDIMRNILEYLDIVDRLPLERTSQSLRLFSQDEKVFHDNLTFEANRYGANISFGRGGCISYTKKGEDCEMEFGDKKKVLRGVSFLKQAFQDFKKILENPKLCLNDLIIWLSVTIKESVEEFIEDAMKFNHLLHVKHLSFSEQSMKGLLKILPSLKPGYLTTITIDSDEGMIGELVEMEQWKQAKYFITCDSSFYNFQHHLCHFKEITIRSFELFVGDYRRMKETLFKLTGLEKCTIRMFAPLDMDTLKNEFGEAIQGIPSIHHCPIPNSKEYFEIKLGPMTIEITRKNR